MNRLYWMPDRNFGDALNPYLYAKISGKGPVRVNAKSKTAHYMAIGSVLNNGNANSIAWGTGLAWSKDKVDPRIDIRAVRGPLSRQVALRCGADCPEIYGDPALLMPRFYNPTVEKKYELGIIPHVIDNQLFTKSLPADIKLLNLCDPIEKVIDDLLQCEQVYSSSLHGLIIADAYGIPSEWVEFSNNVLGDGLKFKDYFASVGIPSYNPTDLRKNGNFRLKKLDKYDITIDLDKLMDACPFKQ